MKPKSGQVTIFIILAILIIAGIALFFALKDNVSKKTEFSPETNRIYNFVQECLESTAEEVIYKTSQGGGYYFPPELSTNTGIPYYLKDNKNYVPSKEQIEEEISYFISKKLSFCTKNFKDFPEYEIQQGTIKTETKISEEFVRIKMNYPLFISRIGSDSSSKIESFEVKIPVHAGIVYNSVKEFLSNSSTQEICLTCLYDISEKNDLFVDMFDYENDSVVFIFKDKNSKLNKKDFEWVFANEY